MGRGVQQKVEIALQQLIWYNVRKAFKRKAGRLWAFFTDKDAEENFAIDTLFDAVAIGEYLIDFTPNGIGPMGYPLYEMNPGGAPANCLAGCARLGGRTGIISAVGNDFFGRFLKQKAVQADIEISGLQTVGAGTTLAFVSLEGQGERELAFVRAPGADTQIRRDALALPLLENTKYLHFGSLSLTDEPARSTTAYAIEYARSRGAKISYDPNYRKQLWRDEAAAKEQMSGA